MYAQRAWIDKSFQLEPLRALTPQAMQGFTVEDLYEVTTELFTDILANFCAFLTPRDFDLLLATLTSKQAQDSTLSLKGGDFDDESTAFARLLIAFGDASVEDLAKSCNDPHRNQIIVQLLELLTCDGEEGSEYEICAQALQFWINYSEFLIDSLFTAGEDKPGWLDSARQHVVKAIEACWSKIQVPSPQTAPTWDADAQANFKSFRADVEDLLQCSNTLLGVGVFERFADLALQSLNDHAWLHLEATLFCLSALAHSVADQSSLDGFLSRLFGSSFFADMANPIKPIPAKTRQSAVIMITQVTAFFERRMEYLPAMLNFLFESLRAPDLSNVAAKAIFAACSSCRKSLIPELGAFLQQYKVLLTWDSADTYTKSSVMGAITAIIQALPTEEAKLQPLSILLHHVEKDAARCLHMMDKSDSEEFQESGTCAMKCLLSMGQSLRTPDDVAIDLDANPPQSTFWTEAEGANLQLRVVRMLQTVSGLMKWSSTIMEITCQVLRTGYKETTPGLFVFHPEITVDFVLASDVKTARLDLVLETAGAMLGRHAISSVSALDSAASTILKHTIELIRPMEGKSIERCAKNRAAAERDLRTTFIRSGSSIRRDSPRR